jgi:ESCRT-II complex subunit VPS22
MCARALPDGTRPEMRRGGLGVRGLKAQQDHKEKLSQAGKAMEAETIGHVETQLESFKGELAKFAASHKTSINSDPAFRHRFQEMTRGVGIDPLMSSKGFWGTMLGVGDFYFELGVQVLDACISSRPINGGLLSMDECIARINEARTAGSRTSPSAASSSSAAAAATTTTTAAASSSKPQALVTARDVVRAVEQLRVLGSGISIVNIEKRSGGTAYIRSVPHELSADSVTVIGCISDSGKSATEVELQKALGWNAARVASCVRDLVAEGIVWVDEGPSGSVRYWLPSGM